MNKTTILLNLILTSFSVVRPIDDTVIIKNMSDNSEKLEVDNLSMTSNDDILRSGETSDVYYPKKDFYLNIRYLREPDINDEETVLESSRNSNATTSKSITVHINPPEENKTQDLGQTRRSESKTINKYENKSNENTKETSNIDNVTERFKDSESEVKSKSSSKSNEEGAEFQNANSKSGQGEKLKKEDYEFDQSNDEPNSYQDLLDNLADTRRMMFDKHDKTLDTKTSEEKRGEPDEVSEVASAPGHTTRANDNTCGNNRADDPSTTPSPPTGSDPTQKENFYNTLNFNTRYDEPIDTSAMSSYERNNLQNNLFLPFTRRNDPHSQQGVERPTILPDNIKNNFNFDRLANAYSYVPPISKQLPPQPNSNNHYDSLFLKLLRASENSRNAEISVPKPNFYTGNYGNIRPSYVIPTNLGLYKLARRLRRYTDI